MSLAVSLFRSTRHPSRKLRPASTRASQKEAAMPDDVQSIFTKQERIAILFKEYDTLRAEIVARTNSHQQYLVITVSLLAALLAFVGKDGAFAALGPIQAHRLFVGAVIIAILGLLSAFRSFWHTRKIGCYIRNIENQINKTVSGERLLLWENWYHASRKLRKQIDSEIVNRDKKEFRKI